MDTKPIRNGGRIVKTSFISFGCTEKGLLEKARFFMGSKGMAIFRDDEFLSIAKIQVPSGVTWFQVRWEGELRGVFETLGEALFFAGAEYAQEVPCAFR